jgi:small-conductance mechanosensitive channel
MRPAETLLLTAGIGRGIFEVRRIQKILPNLAVIATLVVVALALMVALALGGMYTLYFFFVSQGLEQLHALLLTWLVGLLVLMLILLALSRRVQKVKVIAKNPITELIESFLNGLLAEKS